MTSKLNDVQFNPTHVYTIAGFPGHWMSAKWTTTTLTFSRPGGDCCCAPETINLGWQSWRNLCADGAVKDLTVR